MRPTAGVTLREGGRPLLLLLLAALAIKLLVALAAPADDPLAATPTSDARYYVDRALGLLGVQADPLARQTYHLPPLYPWVLAAVPGVGQAEFLGVRLLQAVVGTAALVGVYLLARRRVSSAASLIAVGLTALYGPLTFYETRLLGDSLAFALLVGVLVAADALADRGGAWRAALVGAITGLTCLLRPQALLLVPVLAIWTATLPRRPWPALLVAAAVVIAPATLHNWRASGELIPISDNGGVNLWLANTGPLSGTFATQEMAFGDIAVQAQSARAAAETLAGRTLAPGEVSSTLSRAALAEITAHPGTFLQRVGLRARALIESFETDVTCFPSIEMGLIPPLAPLALPFGLLLGLCAAAVVLGARLQAAPRLPAIAVAAMVVGTALVFFHYSRFRLPLVPLLAIGAASIWDRVRSAPPIRFARGAAAGAALSGAVALSLLPAPHHAPTRANAWTSIGNARLSSLQGHDVEGAQRALDDAERALVELPGFLRAEMLAARACLPLGRFAEAKQHDEAVLAVAPDYPDALLNLAWVHAVDVPDNSCFDEPKARALVEKLKRMAERDPALAAQLAPLESHLAN